MIQTHIVDHSGTAIPTSPTVHQILSHLCQSDCHAFGDLLEWCESRGDCCHAVVCPACQAQFVIDEEELDELRLWTQRNGSLFVCGITYDD